MARDIRTSNDTLEIGAAIGGELVGTANQMETQGMKPKPEKTIRIIVNTREKFVEPGMISFQEVVRLAFPDLPAGPNTSFTVSYRKGSDERPEATLVDGESVKVKKGMVFNVSATDKS
ncbi:multiubiquitin domain-containing protein [Ensifer aridi]|uniref:multiubiquitin domain-containing protein n=1 Tax=Ensifer aridi TaxID=1708715 RepID=UPI000406220D|nr:multiubiquitin domain-containing protein [Ensifer aridi]